MFKNTLLMMHSFLFLVLFLETSQLQVKTPFKNFSVKIDILDFILNKSSGTAADTDPGGRVDWLISRPVHLSDLHYFICYFTCYLTIIPWACIGYEMVNSQRGYLLAFSRTSKRRHWSKLSTKKFFLPFLALFREKFRFPAKTLLA